MADDGLGDAGETLPPAERARWEQRKLSTVALLMTAAVATMFGLVFVAPVAIPFVLALLLAYAVTPLIDYVEMRLRFPRWLALILTVLFGAGILVALVLLIAQSVRDIEANLAMYTERLNIFGANIIAWLNGLGLDIDQNTIRDELAALPIKELAAGALGSLATIFSNAALTLLFFIFLVIGRSPWEDKGGVWEDIDGSVYRYLRAKMITSTAIGLASGLILMAFGVDLAFLFGVLGFLLNFVPTIGSILVIILALPLVFVSLDPLLGVACTASLIVAQNVIGNGIEPKLMGHGLDLHPATILLGLGLWGLIWGPVGMLLSAPLMAVVRIVMSRFDTTRPFAELLAGRIGANARR